MIWSDAWITLYKELKAFRTTQVVVRPGGPIPKLAEIEGKTPFAFRGFASGNLAKLKSAQTLCSKPSYFPGP